MIDGYSNTNNNEFNYTYVDVLRKPHVRYNNVIRIL